MGRHNFTISLRALNIFILMILLLGAIIAICLLAAVPPISRDALIHHLNIPKLYLQHGGMYEIPDLHFSYYPMNLDLLYLIALYLKNDILPKYIHFVFALVTAAMIYQYLKKRLDIVYAVLGGLIFLALPIIVKLSSVAYVDLGLICFSFASLLCLLKWIEDAFKWRYLVVAAICCGLALGTKYNGLIVLFLLTLFVPFIYSRQNPNRTIFKMRALGSGTMFLAISLMVFSPWMIRNYVWTQNPIYPLYDNIISPGEPIPAGGFGEQRHFYVRKNVYNETWAEIALIPIRIFFQGKDNNPKYFDGRLNPFLFILPFFAFLPFIKETRQFRTEKWSFLFFSIFFILLVYFRRDMRIRYVGPVIPPLVILAACGIYRLNDFFTARLASKKSGVRIKQILIFCVISVMLGLNAIYIHSRFRYVKSLSYISGTLSRDEYIEQYCPEYPVMQYANENLSDNVKILSIYTGNRGYYCEKNIVFDLNLLKRIAGDANKPYLVAKELKEMGFSHLLINHELFNYWAKDYSIHEKKILKSFFKQNVTKIFCKNNHGLYRIEIRNNDSNLSMDSR